MLVLPYFCKTFTIVNIQSSSKNLKFGKDVTSFSPLLKLKRIIYANTFLIMGRVQIGKNITIVYGKITIKICVKNVTLSFYHTTYPFTYDKFGMND